MDFIIILSMRLMLFGALATPALAMADIYMQKDDMQQVTLTNLLPDNEFAYKEPDQRHNGITRYVLILESDFIGLNQKIEQKKSSELAIDNVSRQQISDAVNRAAALTAIDPVLLHAVIQVESNYNPNALSRQGAKGLMQLMPSTAKRFNVHNAYDPTQNILGGAQYLHELHTFFNGNLPLILAAYNAGPKAVTKHGMKIPTYIETRLYVPKVLHLYKQLLAEKKYPS